jgi:hypothetical protein
MQNDASLRQCASELCYACLSCKSAAQIQNLPNISCTILLLLLLPLKRTCCRMAVTASHTAAAQRSGSDSGEKYSRANISISELTCMTVN